MTDKILLVDDENDMRETLSILLTGEGYEVIEASNGEEAIVLAEKETPRLILLDINMPKLDGIETCRRLKASETTDFIPVIMVTAQRESFIEAHMAGAADFIEKPFSAVEVAVRVNSALRVLHLTDDLERALAYIREVRKNHPDLDDSPGIVTSLDSVE
jgi:DNA-binding response OmpR family regulator